jgi:hypothetical protein
MTKELIYSIKNPGYDETEWKDGLDAIYRMYVLGASTSMSGCEYTTLEIIQYIVTQIKLQIG